MTCPTGLLLVYYVFMIVGFFSFRTCVKNLFFLATTSSFNLHLGVSGTPLPDSLRWHRTRIPSPLPTPGHLRRHPPGPLRPKLHACFLKNANVTKVTVFSNPLTTCRMSSCHVHCKLMYYSNMLCAYSIIRIQHMHTSSVCHVCKT